MKRELLKSRWAVFLVLLLMGVGNLRGQVGIGNQDPKGVLDLSNSSGANTYPLIVPTMSGTDAESFVVNPKGSGVVAGSVFYDLTEKCLKVYDGTQWNCVGKVITRLGCPRYSLVDGGGLSTSLSPNQRTGFMVLNKNTFPIGTFSAGDIIIEGSNGEILKIEEDNVASINGIPSTVLVSDTVNEYVTTVLIENPSTFQATSTFSYQPPLGGDPSLPREDYCGWNLW